MDIEAAKRKTRRKPELSVFADELEVAFNPKDFVTDQPSYIRGQAPVTPRASVSEVRAETPLPSPAAIASPPIEILAQQPAAITESDSSIHSKLSAEVRTNLGQSSDRG